MRSGPLAAATFAPPSLGAVEGMVDVGGQAVAAEAGAVAARLDLLGVAVVVFGAERHPT